MHRRLWFAQSSLVASCLLMISACDIIGPQAIETSRPDYNEVLARTSKDQTFLNILRVHNHEPTLFMDVGEVDVALQFQGSINATANIPQAKAFNSINRAFSPGHDYGIGGTVQYQETPTIRYQPLQGQALVAQVSTPINVDSLSALVDSGWPVSAVFQLAVSRLTPTDADYYEALDAIMALSRYPFNALVLVPTRADSTASGPNDTLVLYAALDKIRDEHHAVSPKLKQQANKLWHTLWEIYGPSQPVGISESDHRIELRTTPSSFPVVQHFLQTTKENNDTSSMPTTKNTRQETTQHAAHQIYESLQKSASPPTSRPYQLMPVLLTRSALGILRYGTQPDLEWDLVAFVSAKDYEKHLHPMVRHFRSLIEGGTERDFYVFNSGQFTGQSKEEPDKDEATPDDPWHKPEQGDPLDDLAEASAGGNPRVSETGIQDLYDANNYPDRGDRQRHFMIVIYQDASEPAPARAYVSQRYKDKIYYIDSDDLVSQRTFALLAHFLTIQAVPQSAPLTPTISVGGGH